MTTLQEAAKQALEALEHIQRCIGFATATIHQGSTTWCQSEDAIASIKAALAPQAQEPAPQPASEPVANFIVSAVVIKDTSTGFNTQNKLYPVSADNSDEATGKALPLVTNDFPEHRLHTMCFIQIAPAQQAQDKSDNYLNGYCTGRTDLLKEQAAPQPAQGEPTGCACRWDADDNRVATCERHQGWLDVVSEWAERAKAAEKARGE